jgi:outer membrane protein OmpA-like peptidoglycan-associated protein
MKYIIIILMIVFGAYALSAQSVNVSPVPFNSAEDDFAPSLTRHGKSIYFTSDRDGKQKIYVVEKTESGWNMPDEISRDVNNGDQNGSVAITPDGQFMIFAAYENKYGSEGRTDLYSAHKINGKWTEVQNLGQAINSPFWDSQPTLSSDGILLFFVSDRPGGSGGTDIYFSRKTREGWSKAQNAGSSINTSADEIAPVIAYDNKSFYFSSNRSGGFGGFDIYITTFKEGQFSASKLAVEPINSANDDVFYYSVPNSNIAYFSSDRPGGNGGFDIYSAVPNPYPADAVTLVSGTVYDSRTKEPLGSNIIIKDMKTKKIVADLNSDDETGAYFVVLNPGKTYSITSSKSGYLFYSERYEVPLSSKGEEITKDIYLSRNDTRLLIFFDFNKSTLTEESNAELDNVIEFLNQNSNVRVRFEGHTDDVGSDDYNDKLSANRALEVKKYLTTNGIESNRIEAKGYGKRQPLINEKTDEARAKNRRVEMKIIE